MPEYIYHCVECGYEEEVTEPMIIEAIHICPDCGAIVYRRPQVVAVNWGGLKPSQGELHPNIKQIINDAPRRRENEVKDHANSHTL